MNAVGVTGRENAPRLGAADDSSAEGAFGGSGAFEPDEFFICDIPWRPSAIRAHHHDIAVVAQKDGNRVLRAL